MMKNEEEKENERKTKNCGSAGDIATRLSQH
jgi:hypothetical protein